MYEVHLLAEKDACLLIELAREIQTSLRITNAMPSFPAGNGGMALLEVGEKCEAIDQVKRFIERYNNFSIVSSTERPDGTVSLYIHIDDMCGFRALSRSGCFITSFDITPQGYDIRLLVGGKGRLHTFITSLEKEGFRIRVLKKRSTLPTSSDLSDRQREVIHAAFHKGYYDVPRRISLKELADSMGVSPSSVDEILKRAQKKILSYYLSG